MQLPGRLRSTTLGDLLGHAHRARSTGTIELLEEARGRTHRVHLLEGRVTAVEIDGASRRLAEVLREEGVIDEPTAQRSLLRAMASKRLLGDVLVRDFAVPSALVDSALRKQLSLRLGALDALPDARVSFRVTLRPPREALPLEPAEFLTGKKRARDRTGAVATPRPPESREKQTAYRLLGVSEGTDPSEVRRAFRRLARTLHPDLHPFASPEERRALECQLARVTEAYQTLVA
jgi:hypothetical protein